MVPSKISLGPPPLEILRFLHWIEAASTPTSESKAHLGWSPKPLCRLAPPDKLAVLALGPSGSQGLPRGCPLQLSLPVFIFISPAAGDGQGELRAPYTCCLGGCGSGSP